MKSKEEIEKRLREAIVLCNSAMQQSENYPDKKSFYMEIVASKMEGIQQLEWVLNIEKPFNPFLHLNHQKSK